jgi:uncharacterized membrane protein
MNRFIYSIGGLCTLSVALLLARITSSDSMRYIFLLWNLVLAIIPVFIAAYLVDRVKKFGWIRWQQILLSILFIGFLPNSFYLITDFVHLRETNEASLIYDVIMLASFMWSGLVLGYLSVYLIHSQLKKRLSENKALGVVIAIFFAVSFAIYLGRYTRWNTWDLLMQPAGLLFDVSDRFVNPEVHSDTYMTTGILFLIITALYLVIYEASQLVGRKR